MRKNALATVAGLMGLVTMTGVSVAEPAKDYASSPLVTHMMAFDANHDGKLTREELTDPRLYRLFEQADGTHKGFVTREDLTALAAKLDGDLPAETGGFDDGPGPGGPHGPGGRGPGGPPPAPGQVLPPPLERALKLTEKQKIQIADLQKEVDARLANILTEAQLQQLKAGPGGPRGGGRATPQ